MFPIKISSLKRVPPKYGAPNWRTLWPLAGLGGTAALILFLFDPAHAGFYPICFFHHATGWLCPGCGSLRAMHQLLHGNLSSAFQFNPLLVLLLPLLAWLGLSLVFPRLGRRVPSVHPGMIWTTGLVLILFGILRNVL